MMMLFILDICVIGVGFGGLIVVVVVVVFGVEVVLIEKGLMGGDCLNYGCVLFKVLFVVGKVVVGKVKYLKFGVVVEV